MPQNIKVTLSRLFYYFIIQFFPQIATIISLVPHWNFSQKVPVGFYPTGTDGSLWIWAAYLTRWLWITEYALLADVVALLMAFTL